MQFANKLNAAMMRKGSLLVAGLDPNPELLPAVYGDVSTPDRLLPALRQWLGWIIDQTQAWVCAYKPSLGFYQALGGAGLDLLQAVIRVIPPDIPVILDAKHSDLNTSTPLARSVFLDWQMDAITLNAYPGQDLVAPFLIYPGKAVFVLACTSNPSAAELQQYPTPEAPVYLQVVQAAQQWGTAAQLALEVGTTEPEVLAKVRAIAPERLILARSIWQDGVDLSRLLTAGLNKNGDALLLPLPQDWMSQPDLAANCRSLNQEIQQLRDHLVQTQASCELWSANVCLLEQHPHQDLILQLYDLGCILFGNFVQASGATFPYYIDLRKIISNPQVFQTVLNAYAQILQTLSFDRIAGIPYGSLPTATGLALQLNHPMIFPRKEVKAHGTRRLVEGHFQPGETVVVVDDILISGKSAMEGAAKLQSVGLRVQDIVVLLDHEPNVKQTLQTHGYRAHSVLTLSEVVQTLHQADRISDTDLALFSEA
ncbi:MAG: bifunctional orotidine-5'-phosphate decarboxylase/orotate phosphoribosyltransferase [Cyanobacteria bacterium P01_G01_bin.54]